jgi:hypothetical protein
VHPCTHVVSFPQDRTSIIIVVNHNNAFSFNLLMWYYKEIWFKYFPLLMRPEPNFTPLPFVARQQHSDGASYMIIRTITVIQSFHTLRNSKQQGRMT